MTRKKPPPLASLPPEYTSVQYYSSSTPRLALYALCAFCSAGILLIVSSWYIQSFTRIARKPTKDPSKATHVLARGPDGNYTECPIENINRPDNVCVGRLFEYKKNRYVFDVATTSFRRTIWKSTLPLSEFCTTVEQHGLSSTLANELLRTHGSNSVQIPENHILLMLCHKIAHPFYLFQIFSCILWFLIDYKSYAAVILIMSITSISWELFSAKQNEMKLRDLVKCDATVKVYRGKSSPIVIRADQLVLGDLVVVESGKPVVADMALISGEAVVDEASLTGESHPIPKYHLPHHEKPMEQYSAEKFKSNTLFSGSTVIHAKPAVAHLSTSNTVVEKDTESLHEHVLAVVVGSGFSTSKGEMFRSILFPNEIEIRFYKDSYYFLAVLGLFALGAFIMRLVDGITTGQSGPVLLFRSLDLVTIAVPPALPLILTVGIGFSLRRLQKSHIYTIDPERINFVGRINVFCFDKTGTLTTDDLQFHSVVVVDEDSADLSLPSMTSIPPNHQIEMVLAACHGLSKVADGELVGPAVDKEMFRATNWHLEDSVSNEEAIAVVVPPNTSTTAFPLRSPLEILKRFEFDPHLARSSVILQAQQNPTSLSTSSFISNEIFVACKGSAESLKQVCTPESIPPSYDRVLAMYASRGLYVLACGIKTLGKENFGPASQSVCALRRSEVESNFTFTGFLILENPLKPESYGVLGTLKQSSVRSVMITGDSILTAVNVARELEMVSKVLLIDVLQSQPAPEMSSLVCQDFDHQSTIRPLTAATLHTALSNGMDLAITGAALEHLRTSGEFEDRFIRFLVDKTLVFARARPKQKSWIIEQIMAMGNFVAMCGDGMNDCGALKTAHAGIALSNTDASIVAPFTSKQKLITDVLTLLKEGRCALETSFVAFKYMILYPIIQTMMQATLNHQMAALSPNQFILDDLLFVLGLSMFMLFTGPSRELSSKRPTDSLFHPLIIASVVGQVVISAIFFAGAHIYLHKQSWFCSVEDAARYFRSLKEEIPYIPSPHHPNAVCYTMDSEYMKSDFSTVNYESTTIWLFGHFQYIIVAIAYNLFNNFRSPLWTNYSFTAFSIFTLGVASFMILAPNLSWLNDAFQLILDKVPWSFQMELFFLALVNLLVSIVYEWLFVAKIIPHMLQGRRRSKEIEIRKEEKSYLILSSGSGGSEKSWVGVSMEEEGNNKEPLLHSAKRATDEGTLADKLNDLINGRSVGSDRTILNVD